MNLNTKRDAYNQEVSDKKLEERVKAGEDKSISAMEEVNQFLNVVHQDFENFLKRHKKEHLDMNTKMQQINDSFDNSSQQLTQVSDTFTKLATIISCLHEFLNIEHALTH